jgi:hypothetical protein
MSPTPEDIGGRVDRMSDRAVWQRCCRTDAPEDEPLRLLDLAAFAEGGMDPDDLDRIAALVKLDPIAAADIAAARALADNPGQNSAAIDRIVARASELHSADPSRHGDVIPFPGASRRILLHGLAQWGSLAAAVAMAAWLGFAMGSDASLAFSRSTPGGEDAAAIELFDPATGFLQDMPVGVRT